MYRKGWGGPRDSHRAIELFELAADRGFSAANTKLGEMYEGGEGGSANLEEAYFRYLVAVAEHDQTAQGRIDSLRSQLTSVQIELARKRADSWVLQGRRYVP